MSLSEKLTGFGMAFITKMSSAEAEPLSDTTAKLALELYKVRSMLRTFYYGNVTTFSTY